MRRLAIGAFYGLIAACAMPLDANGQAASRSSQSPRADQLTGWVVDVVGKPMAGAEVYIAGTERSSVRTDERGQWRIADPPPGPRVVVARQIGYMPVMRELEIGNGLNDTLTLLLRRYPQKLSTVEVRARSAEAATYADIAAERLMQLRVGSGRLFTRDQILRTRPYSIAELITGVPGIVVTRGQSDIVVTTSRAGVGVMNREGMKCQLQFYYNSTPIDNETVATLDPLSFRSVEVYPQALVLSGLPSRPDRCGAVVIN